MRFILAACAVLVTLGFTALGTWQVFRLQWKLDLIQRVEQRVHAAPAPAPGPAGWAQVNAAADEYRHVRLSGNFLYESSTRVQAATELGSGFWLLTPLCGTDGSIVLVNRGFIPFSAAVPAPAAAPQAVACAPRGADASVVNLTGLLRISEPGGGFLRHNDAAGEHWYSRDVQAIAAARSLSRLSHVAPYFVDADAGQEAVQAQGVSVRPVGGLTVISFHNNHLVYALTWYALALMMAGACLWVAREERKSARPR
ncbi:MAG TPA: SURF1 family protein [Janthinobacterium sp.]|nr:SURF1 family protein [Janthinobacterium sp.]